MRHVSSIPGSGRAPGGGHGDPLHYSCLENPMDRGAWWALVHRVAELDTAEGIQQGTRGRSLVAVCGLLWGGFCCEAQALGCKGFSYAGHGSVVVAPWRWSTGSIAVVRWLSCSRACGISPDQGSNPCLLPWQLDSLPPSHQGSPEIRILTVLSKKENLEWVFCPVINEPASIGST